MPRRAQEAATCALKDIVAAMQDLDNLIVQALIDKVPLGRDFPLNFSSVVWSMNRCWTGNCRSCKDWLGQVRKQFERDRDCDVRSFVEKGRRDEVA